MKKQWLVAGVMAGLMAATPVLAQKGANLGIGQSQLAAAATLDATEAETLTFMREEEKLARDVYLELSARWDAPIFQNIARSEQQHMDAMGRLVAAYGIPDPVVEDVSGVFVNTELQQLFNQLVAQGSDAYMEAFHVGAFIEEVDIEDLMVAIEQTDNQDVIRAYENLLRGSRNHLRAFVGTIERFGEVYQAQYLDQSTVDAIVDSPMERGGRGGKGAGGRQNR